MARAGWRDGAPPPDRRDGEARKTRTDDAGSARVSVARARSVCVHVALAATACACCDGVFRMQTRGRVVCARTGGRVSEHSRVLDTPPTCVVLCVVPFSTTGTGRPVDFLLEISRLLRQRQQIYLKLRLARVRNPCPGESGWRREAQPLPEPEKASSSCHVSAPASTRALVQSDCCRQARRGARRLCACARACVCACA